MSEQADAPPGAPQTDPPTFGPLQTTKDAILRFLPAGTALATEIWNARHRAILLMLYGHAIGLALFGLYMGWGPLLSFGEGALIAVIALLASWTRLSRRFRASAAAFGAVTASAILVQFSGGYIEAHFHFFVMVAVIALYQDWVPFLLAAVYVALDHGIIGTLYPEWVYNHPAAIANPWQWAAIHAILVTGQCIALMALWNSAENAQKRELQQKLEFDRVERESGFKSHLLRNVSHELKTPLTPLQMNVQMLKKGRLGSLDERQARVVALLDRNLDRLITLVDQTIDVSRLEARRLELEPQEVDIRKLAENAVEDYKDYAEERDIHIGLEGPAKLPAHADPDRIAQVLHNLVNNAVKFSKPGGRVSLSLEQGTHHALVHVQDTGRGLTEEEQGRLFEPFVQVHDTKEMTDPGSGLGLYLAKEIVAHHHGKIWCSSPGHGKGSTFSIALPLEPPQEVHPVAQGSDAETLAGTITPAP